MGTIIKNDFITDSDKIKKIDRQELEDLSNILAGLSETIERSLSTTGFSLKDWFTAYILSPEYQKLNRESKIEVFNYYEDLRFILNEVDDFMIKNKLGEYNY